MENNNLNKNQEAAVKTVAGPMLIVAGAGTGKTTVITEKIKSLVNSGVKPNEILALTFTEKAANEMVERLDQVMPFGYEEPWVATFHKFGDRLLKAEGLEIGLDPDYKILTQPEQWLLIKRHLFEMGLKYFLPLGNPNKFIGAIIKFFSRMADEDIAADDLRSWAQKNKDGPKSEVNNEQIAKYEELANAFDKYQELKIEVSGLDYGDLLIKTLELFRKRKTVLKKYQQQFKHVLVDEFQDTNWAQYELIKLLVPAATNPGLTVVGDDSQSIYRFRGAAISNILNFMDDYPKARQVILTDNYRSYQPILDGAYKLIKHNDPETLEARLGISKNLKSLRKMAKHQEGPQIVEMEDEAQELEFVVKTIYRHLAQALYTYKDIAVITRSNSQLDIVANALKQQGLPFRRVGNRGLFDQTEVKTLINLLKVIVNPHDSVGLYQLLSFEDFHLPMEKILVSIQNAKRKAKSLWEEIVNEEYAAEVVAIIKEAQTKVVSDKATKILLWFMRKVDYVKPFVITESLENSLKLKNISLLFQYLRNLEANKSNIGVVEIVTELSELEEAGENPSQAEVEDVDAITLTTAHSAKGLEFPVVFVTNMIAGRFPSYNRKDPIELPDEVLKEQLPKEDNTAEERRLFYVAITRARDYLYLSFAKNYGGVRQRRPSGFLAETGFPTIKYHPDEQLSLLPLTAKATPYIKLPTEKFELKATSYSQIETFKDCPLKYKYRYVLQIPSEPNHALNFGQSIHEVLKNFHQLEMLGKEVSLETLHKLYERSFIAEGYDSKEHLKERFDQGKAALEEYFNVYRQALGKPIMLEREFRLNLNGVILKGKIDRIDETDEGLKIIDYKTGSAQKKNTVDRDEQLSIYALAGKEALNLPIEKLALYFIEDNSKVETKRSEKQIADKKAELAAVVEKIKQGEFIAKPGFPFPCGFCEFKLICPHAEKG
jgi:DNA helicase-2/ATP-dependent DNA helicase PcrA